MSHTNPAPFAVAETRAGMMLGILLLVFSALQVGALLFWSLAAH